MQRPLFHRAPTHRAVLCKTFLPRNQSHKAERKPQSSFRAAQEPFTPQPQGMRSRVVKKLVFTTQSRARRTRFPEGWREEHQCYGRMSNSSSDSTIRLLETSVAATQGMTTSLLQPHPIQVLLVSSFPVQTGISPGHSSAQAPYTQDHQVWREHVWSKFTYHVPQSNRQPRSILCR